MSPALEPAQLQLGSAMGSAVVFAVTLPALLVAHTVADHWIQTTHQATAKGAPGWVGRRACAAHVATYTATTTAAAAAWWAFALPITPAGFALGQLVSAITHYLADRRTPLARIATRTGNAGFYILGAPRPGRDDNPTSGPGRTRWASPGTGCGSPWPRRSPR